MSFCLSASLIVDALRGASLSRFNPIDKNKIDILETMPKWSICCTSICTFCHFKITFLPFYLLNVRGKKVVKLTE